MTTTNFDKRLTHLQSRRLSAVSKEEAKAFKEILEYLDGLAERKTLRDPSAQREIAAANKFMRSQCA